MSYAAELQSKVTGEWRRNSFRFATKEETDAFTIHWEKETKGTALEENIRFVESDDEPNAIFKNGKLFRKN